MLLHADIHVTISPTACLVWYFMLNYLRADEQTAEHVLPDGDVDEYSEEEAGDRDHTADDRDYAQDVFIVTTLQNVCYRHVEATHKFTKSCSIL